MLGYTTVFTSLPVFTLILDEDIDKEKAFKYEKLYEILLKGRECATKQFIIWLFRSIYQVFFHTYILLYLTLGVYYNDPNGGGV